MQCFLSDRGIDEHDREHLPACVMQYFLQCFRPALGSQISERNGHEMQAIAEALDHMLRGNLTRGMTILIQRFKSLETASHDGGSFERGRHLEITRPPTVTCVSSREAALARSNMLEERKLAKPRH